MYCYLLFPSLTRAQQAAARLWREGIRASLIRAPRELSGEGCLHGLRLPVGAAPGALGVLDGAGLAPKRVFVTAGDGRYEEVEL